MKLIGYEVKLFRVQINPDDIDLQMKKRMFSDNDKATVYKNIKHGAYEALIEDGKVQLIVDGYEFILDGEIL